MLAQKPGNLASDLSPDLDLCVVPIGHNMHTSEAEPSW